MRHSMLVVAAAATMLLAPCGFAPPATQGQEREREREREREIAALQGSWKLLREEQGGKVIESGGMRWNVKGMKIHYELKGETKAEWRIERIDPEKSPAHIDIWYPELKAFRKAIYVRSGEYMIMCFSKLDGERPTDFKTGVRDDGQQVIVWKIER